MGFHIEYLYLGPLHIPNLGLISYPITVLWLVSMMNVINFLDGLDGLAGGVVGITALVLLVAAAGRQPEIVVLDAALVGSCIGYLIFNFHPARIFMGDGGAQFLGLTVALLSVVGVAKVAVGFAVIVPGLAMGVPILDTVLAIVRRRRRGLSIAHADAGHLHHRALSLGFSQREICVLFYGGSAILGSAGLVIVILPTVVGNRLHALDYRVPIPSQLGLRCVLPAAPWRGASGRADERRARDDAIRLAVIGPPSARSDSPCSRASTCSWHVGGQIRRDGRARLPGDHGAGFANISG
jgi:hypothetical protein